MKQNLLILATFVAAIGFAVSCTGGKDDLSQQKTNPSVIRAGLTDFKVSLSDNGVGNGMSLAWGAGDALRVIATADGDGNELFNIQDGYTATSAQFSGTPVAGTEFTVFYPGTYADVAAINARSYTSQVQIGNGSVAHLEWNAMEAGIADYGTVNFSAKQNGALRFVLSNLPFSKVYKVALKASSPIFSTTNAGDVLTDELVLTLKADASTPGITLGASEALTAYLMVSWNDNVIPANSSLTIEAWGDQESPYTDVRSTGASDFHINGGKVTHIADNTNWTEPLFWAGDGTSANPYIIKTAYHLGNVKTVMDAASDHTVPIYFRMEANVDLNNAVWEQVNKLNPSGGDSHTPMAINFDGNNKSISNFSIDNNAMGLVSFFGEISGEVKNLTFNNGTISSGGNNGSAGILAGIANNLTVTNVDANNVDITITGNPGESTGIGGLVGYAMNSTFSGCDLSGCDIDLNGKNAQNVGGLIGRIRKTGTTTVTGCSVANAEISAQYCAGGLVGKIGVDAPATLSGNTVSGVTVSYTTTLTSGDYANQVGAGGLVGVIAAGSGNAVTLGGAAEAARNTVSSLTINQSLGKVGGVAGSTISGDITINRATVGGSIEATSAGVGGFIGRSAVSLNISNGTMTAALSGPGYTSGIIGTLAGDSSITYSIDACHVAADITSTDIYAGGIASYCPSAVLNISNSSYAGTITATGKNNVGGLIGRAEYHTTVESCKTSGSIVASTNVGGIAGALKENSSSTSTITKSYSTMTLTPSNNQIGGIVGCAVAGNITISESYFNGNITVTTTTSTVGGIVGLSAAILDINNCYTDGILSGKDYTGGIFGKANSGAHFSITNCYSKMSITGGGASGRVAAGIVAGGSDKMNITVQKCLAWHPLLDFSGTTGNFEGVILGRRSGGGTQSISDNYYTSALVLGSTYKTSETTNHSSLGGSLGTGSHVDGEESSLTCSAQADAIGWDKTTIWNLTSGDYPVLRRVVE